MRSNRPIELDVAVFGGGVAGLWLLDALAAAGYKVLLLEAGALGGGQTIASQGIIHGGLKYTLDGLLNPSAEAIREMPALWRACLAGARLPDLRGVRVRADHCHLWRTSSLTGMLGMVGAQHGLRVRPEKLERDERPDALRACPGAVFRLDEQVINCVSLINALRARHERQLLAFDPESLAFDSSSVSASAAPAISVRSIGPPCRTELRPANIVLMAGEGNQHLREKLGLPVEAMQRRPLHMVLARGDLPPLYGHCVDGARTRVTITTAADSAGRSVWQIGGQIAEDGVRMEPQQLVRQTAAELADVLPGVDWRGVEFSTYRVDRAEARTRGLLRPDDAACLHDGHVITGWPTKLALAPRLAEKVLELLPPPRGPDESGVEQLNDWPRPAVAKPPWEEVRQWFLAP